MSDSKTIISNAMSERFEKGSAEADQLLKTIGALNEASDELKDELEDSKEIDPEEAGNILGMFIKGVLSVFKF